ncbi:MAG: polysaccharide pyruvyl transferase family protein, partial [Selenomonadaceae bacterium]|nr:polysaccharide pyruvyl transferase family protein [Selenomonadaceae bacterium]
GVNSIPDAKKELFRRGISDFNYLSVREENGVKLIHDLTGRTSLHVLDPVLLLTKKEWLAVAQKPTWFKERYSRGYVLTYHLDRLPPTTVNSLADKLNLPVINLFNTENYNHFTVGPAEFVWLFAHASFVFTNSFHGAAFSTLFKRPFILNGLRMGNDPRFVSLLKMFGLGDRFNPAEPMEIDFSRSEEILSDEKAKAFNFLAEAFGVNPCEGLADTNQNYFPTFNFPAEAFDVNPLEKLLGGDA